MLKIRKAIKIHRCIICGEESKPKQKYMQMSKKQNDDSYINAAICENCTEKLIQSKISED